ncbi:O-acetyl-ADP-ribose deacetylase (regulator of RNase III), contains Macro domain [Fibrobacter sp. UWT3]|uniref:macro domain-containing protein n=1 Tax=Fibrobacter sp. UWT3 TaxID=1896225 RepID=UPI000BD65425|nr:macro domain-containing protein [Fibrobacter sp. UWT3]SOE75586.1 O-acetyl-ADP-ribose deacetylase (regulator of RNase III), contains Macro domain [Fibrobacter sp. UWT3]
MPLEIVRNDITKVKADAIVNSANRQPVCGGGTEYQIYEAAGHEDLLKAREQVGPLDVAEVAVTPAFALDAKYIIHTVGPKWMGGKSGEMLALAGCYRNALEMAKELGCESIAFPLISSGVFRFPKDYAVRIATQAIGEFLQTNEMLVTLVVFDRKAFEVSEDLYSDIQAFIDDNYVQDKYGDVRRYARRRWQGRNTPDYEEWPAEECDKLVLQSPRNLECVENLAEKCSISLDDILAKPGETFCDKLFNLIHEKNLDDVDVYKKANLDRKHFSKIRSNVKYKPTKKTALALAIALHLNMDETKDLLARAELALSPSNRGDLVVSYFIERGMYDIWEINNMLFKFGLPTLGV